MPDVKQASKNQASKLLFLGLPVLILVLAGIAMSGFLAATLLIQGIAQGAIGQIVVGGIISALWLMMMYKTALDAIKTTLGSRREESI